MVVCVVMDDIHRFWTLEYTRSACLIWLFHYPSQASENNTKFQGWERTFDIFEILHDDGISSNW